MKLKKILSLLLSFSLTASTNVVFAQNAEDIINEAAKTPIVAVNDVSEENTEVKITLGDTYTVDLSDFFEDADETETLTYKVSVNKAEAVSVNKNYSFKPEKAGKYELVFTAEDGISYSNTHTIMLKVNELPKPTALTIENDAENVIDGVVIAKKGDKFTLTAYDENGKKTPVKWKNTSYNGGGVSIDEDSGETEVINDVSSGTSYLYFTATSTLDETVTQKITVKLGGYLMSAYQKTKTVQLSKDGQSAKNVTVTAGKSGHNIWSYNIPEGIAELAAEPGNGGDIKFNLFRPGIITATFKLDINETLTDTSTITVTGVAVEDSEGNRGKTYITLSENESESAMQLLAYAAADREIVEWSSADETVAVVDENGLVTAKGIGNVIISAKDSEGEIGGIKIVVESEESPYFENLQFLSNVIENYSASYSFSPTLTEYDLKIKLYSTTRLTLQNTTAFNTEKYSALAEYTDINGNKQAVEVKNGAITYLDGIPFGTSKVTITLSDKTNEKKKTVYNFNVTRPRDTSKTIKQNGITIIPGERSLLATKYNGYSEGTMFKLAEDGGFKIKTGSNLDTGIISSHYSYKCFLFDDAESFTLSASTSTAYAHIRYSEDGENWYELAQGGGTTKVLNRADEKSLTVRFQVIDDKTYAENKEAGNDGFYNCTPAEYVIITEKAETSASAAQMLTAETPSGDWYPNAFSKDVYSYAIIAENDENEKNLTYTVSEGAQVKISNTLQTADENGNYMTSVTTTQKTVEITSKDGKITNSYKFKLQKKVDKYPDKVIDFLCINSQYTNGIGAGNAASPWVSLSGQYTSIGNFGGYITYYYADAITDNPNNKYGIDFYVYGNASKDVSTSTKTSFFEPAQAWVSEDGEKWYALAGSAHYDDGVDWNYSVTYRKTANGKTAWEDNRGNSNNGLAYSGLYPSKSIYTMNNLSASDSITLSGIALPARNGEIASYGTSIDAYPVKWGYADCFVNGTKGKDVNPYTDNTNFDLQTNGFDLQWAVDKDGNPVDVSDKEFHYVRLVSASNIWHPSFGEKSPEIAGVMKTTPQNEAVGKTSSPSSVTITDGAEEKIIYLNEAQQVYSVNIGDMKYVSLSLDGAKEDDNIYINNTRIAYDSSADGLKITKETGEKLIRIVVQNSDKEPLIYLLKITGTAEKSNDLIEDIKLDVNGISRKAITKDGKTYTTSVGYKISSVGIVPVADSDVEIKINDEAPSKINSLKNGENIFIVTAKRGEITHSVTLKITKDTAPTSSGNIKVYFTLLGDDSHGDNGEVHTLKNGNLDTWIKKTAIEISSPATVLDVFEKALGSEHSFTNADGNYISEIDDLAEFSNGSLSGWMYTLNGSYPSKGVAEQIVKNGDVIIFHYTDDYTKEQNQKVTSASSSNKNNKKDDTVNAGTLPDIQILPFNDIKNHWANEAIKYVYENSVMNGINETTFSPDENMTRAMLVTILYRLEKSNFKYESAVFEDVTAEDWYVDAVAWAKANNIVKGLSETEFAPNDNVTREQLAVILYRYANFKNVDTSASAELSGFSDFNNISSWAYAALEWAYAAELITGMDNGSLLPDSFATRAQVATIIMRFCKNIIN